MNKSQSVTKLADALAKAQAKMPVVRMNAQNPFLKNKYADLGAVIEASRPVLAEFGLSISQFPTSDSDKIGVTSLLMHASGEWLEDTIYINATDSKGLSVAQSAGVVISYLRRYAWAAILGLYADEDNDGHTGDKKQPEQAKPITQKSNRQSMIEAYGKYTKEANTLGVEVVAITPNMTDDEIITAGKDLKSRIEDKKKAGS